MLVNKYVQYERFKAKNQNLYGRCIIAFAERWAEKMEERMNEGWKIEKMYDGSANASNICNITPKMKKAACEVLLKYWAYGQNLKSAIKGDDRYLNRKER